MQEGILALMQLPKTVVAIEELHESGGSLISVLTHPTTAGVLASFASLGDVTLAEPGALMSFAGPRVVAQTTREKCRTTSGSPSRATASAISTRSSRVGAAADDLAAAPPLRQALMPSEAEMRLRERLSKLGAMKLLRGTKLSGELERLQDQLDRLHEEPSAEEIWQSVELARHQDRPYTLDYVERIFEDFFELHGDRGRADDHAIVTGLGKLDGRTIVLVGQQKGRDLKERTKRNFGMPFPRGTGRRCGRCRSRTATGSRGHDGRHTGRLPGRRRRAARPGRAIARSQAAMVRLSVPTVACVIGEGGSGGAVAIAVADRVLMQEHAIYSVISPEGCAAILWRDAGRRERPPPPSSPTPRTAWSSGWSTRSWPSPKAVRRRTTPRRRMLENGILAALEEIESLDPDERRQRREKYR